jgi:thymidine kinase
MDKYITTIVGPMFSGKTTSILTAYEMLKQNNSCMLVKPALDNRYGNDKVQSHDGINYGATNVKDSTDFFKKYINNPTDYVFIDEVQFFDEGIINVLEYLRKRECNVMSCGLNKDFRGEAFKLRKSDKTIDDILEVSDEILLLHADCAVCGNEAYNTFRKSDSKELVVLGEKDIYEPRCDKHFYVVGE